MANAFQRLQQRFQQIGKGISPAVLEKSVTVLQQWLEEHANQLTARTSSEFNGTMMQWFHWYIPNDGNHWQRLQAEASALAKAGITALWLPPAYKANGGAFDVGYGIYDLFDLGEFDQKGTVRTKYGTKDQYIAGVKVARAAGLQIYADVVFNHKMGGDAEEEFEAIPFDPSNRNHPLGNAETIKSWTRYDFPGRGNQYSSMKWRWWHFDSVDYNSYKPDYRAVYRMKDKNFDTKVDLQSGNYDYLMGCDLDMNHPEVRGELKYWGEWILDTVGVDGFRLDAIKHIHGDFFSEWLDHLEAKAGRELFTVGEYWSEDYASLSWYIGNAGGRLHLFDVPLHYNLHRASKSGSSYDMRKILDGTLMQNLPLFAVTFVDNHDTQPLQALESMVESWFKPLAYALILLRAEGYPMIFYADYYGATYKDKGRDGNEYEIVLDSHRWLIDRLLVARQHCAYGPQYTYFTHENVIGWTRLGSKSHPRAMAVMMSNGAGGSKWMEVGKPNATFYDITAHIKTPVQTNADGWGEFHTAGGSVSVWLEQQSILDQLIELAAPLGIAIQ